MSKSIEKRGDAVRIEVRPTGRPLLRRYGDWKNFAPIFKEQQFRSRPSPQSIYLFDVILQPSFGSGQPVQDRRQQPRKLPATTRPWRREPRRAEINQHEERTDKDSQPPNATNLPSGGIDAGDEELHESSNR